MTGEQMIIEAAAAVLRASPFGSWPELRKAFWIAGYCEHCAAAVKSDGLQVCPECQRPIVNRCSP
jgi:uncharacterized CHY-type Zn-finger protein